MPSVVEKTKKKPVNDENIVEMSSKNLKPNSQQKSRRRSRVLADVTAAAEADLEEVDDEADRRAMNNLKIAERNQLSNVAGRESLQDGTPQNTAGPRSGLTQAQISDHYNACIQLSAQNKLSADKAFSYKIIDFIDYMITKDEAETGEVNFQLAGTSLDASAKIYAYRVDLVHQQTCKMASGLGRGDKGDKKQRGQDEMNENGQLQDGEESVLDLLQSPRQKRKRKVWKGKTIEQNLKNINLDKLDVEFEVDPMFNKVRSKFDECTSAGLLLNTLRTESDETLRLVLQSYVDQNEVAEVAQHDEQPMTSSALEDLKGTLSLIASSEGNSLCPSVDDFEFNKEGRLDAVFNVEPDFNSASQKTIPSVGDIEIQEYPSTPLDDGHDSSIDYGPPAGGADDDDEDVETNNNAFKFSMLDVITEGMQKNNNDLEYADTLQTWKGPQNWKKSKTSVLVNGGEKVEKEQQSKTRQRGKKRPPQLLFSPEDSKQLDAELQRAVKRIRAEIKKEPPDFSDLPKPTRKATVIPESQYEKYADDDYALQSGSDYDPANLSRLNLKPLEVQRRSSRPNSPFEIEGGDYNMDNDVDRMNFCTDIANDSDDDIDFGAAGDYDDVPDATVQDTEDMTMMVANDQPVEGFQGGMVEEPNKIQKINIKYTKQAKKLDVRRLKHAMWKILTKDVVANVDSVATSSSASAPPAPTPRKLPGKMGTETALSFRQLMQQLPSEVSETMAKNLSLPIAFVCFLHMCNEKSLQLNQEETGGDFNISQG